jgi:hypothetical protein
LTENAEGFVKQDEVVLHGRRGIEEGFDCPENT